MKRSLRDQISSKVSISFNILIYKYHYRFLFYSLFEKNFFLLLETTAITNIISLLLSISTFFRCSLVSWSFSATNLSTDEHHQWTRLNISFYYSDTVHGFHYRITSFENNPCLDFCKILKINMAKNLCKDFKKYNKETLIC